MHKQKFSKIFELPIGDIHTNKKLFQGRQEDFSRATYEKIMREGFDKSQEPIVVWYDKLGKKYIVISGHSRLAAAQQLYNAGDEDLATLPVKEFNGDLEDAISYAVLESNRGGTAEGLLSDVKAYKKAVAEGCNKDCLKGYFKTDSYIATLQRLSYLDEEGEFLRILNDTGQAKNFANIQKYAEWTGELRKYYEEKLTDKHEKEIFNFLFSESNKLFRKEEFINLIEKAVNHLTFDPSKPLNLKNFHSKSVYQIYAETEAEQVKKEIEELRDLLEKKQKLLARTEKEERRKEINLEISGINRNIVKKIETLDRLKEQAKEADKMQLDLFAAPPENTLKEQDKTPKEQPEKVLSEEKTPESTIDPKKYEIVKLILWNKDGKKNGYYYDVILQDKKTGEYYRTRVKDKSQTPLRVKDVKTEDIDFGKMRIIDEKFYEANKLRKNKIAAPPQNNKTPEILKTIKERIEDLKTIFLLDKTDKKIQQRIKDLELINQL